MPRFASYCLRPCEVRTEKKKTLDKKGLAHLKVDGETRFHDRSKNIGTSGRVYGINLRRKSLEREKSLASAFSLLGKITGNIVAPLVSFSDPIQRTFSPKLELCRCFVLFF